MGAHEIAISLHDVGLTYMVRSGYLRWEKYKPFEGVTFNLQRGETVGLIGRNGAGKSSLLRLIAGIIEPDEGRVINHGVQVSLLALGVGFVPHLTGRENAMLSGMLFGLSRRKMAERMDAISEFSGLAEFMDRPLKTYSSGMRARLGFTVALQANPDVLLIDEVLGVGDEEFRKKSTVEMKRLIKSDKTIVLVSHNIPTIRELCDKVVWIEGGHLEYEGDVSRGLELYNGCQDKSES
jgi:lipopolysaccharide transport system ATP-binding protein